MPAKTIVVMTDRHELIDLGLDEVYMTNKGASIAWKCDNPDLERLTITFNKTSGTPFKHGVTTLESRGPHQQTNIGVVKCHDEMAVYDYNIAVKLSGMAEFKRDPQVVVDVESMYMRYVPGAALVGGTGLAIWAFKQLRLHKSAKLK